MENNELAKAIMEQKKVCSDTVLGIKMSIAKIEGKMTTSGQLIKWVILPLIMVLGGLIGLDLSQMASG